MVDADTLHWKRTFQSSSGQNFGGIEYLESTDQYVVSGGNGSKFRLMNSDFEISENHRSENQTARINVSGFLCDRGLYYLAVL